MCLFLCAGPSPFVLLESSFTLLCLATVSKRSVSCICTTQAPMPSSRASADERREDSGHYSPRCVCVPVFWAASQPARKSDSPPVWPWHSRFPATPSPPVVPSALRVLRTSCCLSLSVSPFLVGPFNPRHTSVNRMLSLKNPLSVPAVSHWNPD